MLQKSESEGLVALRILRLGRLLRVLKLQKYNKGLTVFINTIRSAGAALAVLVFVMTLLSIFFAALLFVFEEGVWYSPEDDCGDGSGWGSCGRIYGENGIYLRSDVSGVSYRSLRRSEPVTIGFVSGVRELRAKSIPQYF